MKIFKTLVNLIFPINCVGCDKEETWICDNCSQKIAQNTIHYCLNCKKQTKLGEICHDCAPRFFIDRIWIASDFQNKYLSQLIKLYKYKFAQNISNFLGFFLLDFFKNQVLSQEKKLLAKNILIIPVPLHSKRLRWRGFNQSEKLASIIANELKIPISINNLKRIKFKKPQATLKKEDRIKNIHQAFTWHGDRLNNQSIILVDDVTTTGATLNECANVLKENGAKEVWGLVLANG